MSTEVQNSGKFIYFPKKKFKDVNFVASEKFIVELSILRIFEGKLQAKFFFYQNVTELSKYQQQFFFYGNKRNQIIQKFWG